MVSQSREVLSRQVACCEHNMQDKAGLQETRSLEEESRRGQVQREDSSRTERTRDVKGLEEICLSRVHLTFDEI